MSKTSVVIPARDEPYLTKTVEELLANATGEIEIVVIFDGWACELPDDKRIKPLYFKPAVGLRAGMQAGVQKARGKYLLKIDAHCRICEGYDEILKANCADNWIVVPRRYDLTVETWEVRDKPEDSTYLVWPYSWPDRPLITFRPWINKTMDRRYLRLDEDMGFQGSCYFMEKAHWNRLGGMSDTRYGTWKGEPEELALKTWLGPWDGRVMRNKNAWYAHWTKPKMHWFGRPGLIGYISDKEWWDGLAFMFDFWWHDKWEGAAHGIDWLVDRFWPLPRWQFDWKEIRKQRMVSNGSHTKGINQDIDRSNRRW